jgi:plastocyanin
MRRSPRSAARLALGLAALALPLSSACSGGDSDSGPGFSVEDGTGSATYEFTIPAGAGEALDAGTPLEILPGTLEASVGETIKIVNLDDRGHNVGPWFVGANETLRQEFTSAGTFEGVCTVHPSGELVLNVTA